MPEYEDKAIFTEDDSDWLWSYTPQGEKLAIQHMTGRKKFAGFFVDAATPGERPCRLEEVATNCEGHKVVARFRKD
jgi:hypothetical protein